MTPEEAEEEKKYLESERLRVRKNKQIALGLLIAVSIGIVLAFFKPFDIFTNNTVINFDNKYVWLVVIAICFLVLFLLPNKKEEDSNKKTIPYNFNKASRYTLGIACYTLIALLMFRLSYWYSTELFSGSGIFLHLIRHTLNTLLVIGFVKLFHDSFFVIPTNHMGQLLIWQKESSNNLASGPTWTILPSYFRFTVRTVKIERKTQTIGKESSGQDGGKDFLVKVNDKGVILKVTFEYCVKDVSEFFRVEQTTAISNLISHVVAGIRNAMLKPEYKTVNDFQTHINDISQDAEKWCKSKMESSQSPYGVLSIIIRGIEDLSDELIDATRNVQINAKENEKELENIKNLGLKMIAFKEIPGNEKLSPQEILMAIQTEDNLVQTINVTGSNKDNTSGILPVLPIEGKKPKGGKA